MKEDKSESQAEIIKVSSEAKKIRNSADDAIKKLLSMRKQQLSLKEIIVAHLEMAMTRVNLDDSYRNMRQICLKGLSQFSDDYSLQKVRDLCTKLVQFSFVNFPENLLHDFQKDRSHLCVKPFHSHMA